MRTSTALQVIAVSGGLVVADIGVPVLFPARAATGQQDAPAALRKARAAVGNEATRIKSLILEGTIMSGFNGVTAEPMTTAVALTIQVLTPSYYLNRQQGSSITYLRGFRREVAFFESRRTGEKNKGTGRTSPSMGAGELAMFRRYVARLLLGMFVEATAVLPIAPTAPASTLRVPVKGPDEFAAVVELDPTTNVPVRLRYQDTVDYPERAVTDADRKAGVVPPWKHEVTEVTVSFEDRRHVDGFLVPFTIRQTAAGRRFEEIRLSRVVVNPPLTPADFGALPGNSPDLATSINPKRVRW